MTPLFFRTIKSQEIYSKYLEQIFLMYMKDRASEVRQIGLEKLPVSTM